MFFDTPRNLTSRTLAYPRETFDAVDVDITFAITFLVINAKVFLVTEVNDGVVRAKAVGINSRIKADFALDNSLQGLGLDVFDNLGINFSVSLVDTEEDMFIFRSATTLAVFVARAEV